MIPPAATEDRGLELSAAGFVLSTSGQPSQSDIDGANALLEGTGAGVAVEQGTYGLTIVWLVLALVSGVVTLAGSAICLGLAAGAVVAGLGTGLGIGLGTVIGYVAINVWSIGPWSVPWLFLALVGMAVPVLALAAAAFTRSRLPLVRRFA